MIASDYNIESNRLETRVIEERGLKNNDWSYEYDVVRGLNEWLSFVISFFFEK